MASVVDCFARSETEGGRGKFSTDAVAAARHFTGSVGGAHPCQVAVHLTFASSAGHCLIGRRLYITQERAGDEERRALTGVPDELCFAGKPRLAAAIFHAAGQRGIPASFFLRDEVYGGRKLPIVCRKLGLGYVVRVLSNHRGTTPATKLSVTKAATRLPK